MYVYLCVCICVSVGMGEWVYLLAAQSVCWLVDVPYFGSHIKKLKLK